MKGKKPKKKKKSSNSIASDVRKKSIGHELHNVIEIHEEWKSTHLENTRIIDKMTLNFMNCE